ncbi:DNA-3-methyladenine glycosylase [Candidatus Microgenomates bacterium]|nr:DNA-3-methyladenine glycosylase [Candidatus Microgenomates bacterium]
MESKVLNRNFYQRKAKIVAPLLLGKYLVRQIGDKKIIGKITEVETYLGEKDPAAHVSKGRTKRTEIIYGKAGHAYIYIIHGHIALNVVCETIDSPGSVLIRSIEAVKNITTSTNGPGKLTKAMAITKDLYGIDLTNKKSGLYICDGEKVKKDSILITPRIGVRDAKDWLLRFVIKK